MLTTIMTTIFQKYFIYVTLKKVAEDDKMSLLKTRKD